MGPDSAEGISHESFISFPGDTSESLPLFDGCPTVHLRCKAIGKEHVPLIDIDTHSHDTFIGERCNSIEGTDGHDNIFLPLFDGCHTLRTSTECVGPEVDK